MEYFFNDHIGFLNVFCLLFIISIMSSCAAKTFIYQPAVNLTLVEKTINKKVRVEEFKMLIPDRDSSGVIIITRKNKHASSLIPFKTNFTKVLSTEVTDAIIKDFERNKLFGEIGRNVENPDLILKGEINEFQGKMEFNRFAKISAATIIGIFTWFLGMDVGKIQMDMNITMYVYSKNEDLLGTYNGYLNKIEEQSVYSPNNDKNGKDLSAKTNLAFSQAILDIRKQLLNNLK